MVDRIRYPTVSYLPFYYVFFQFLLLTIFNLQANILTTKDILSNLDFMILGIGSNLQAPADTGNATMGQARLENTPLLLSHVLALEFWSPLMRMDSTSVMRRNSMHTLYFAL